MRKKTFFKWALGFLLTYIVICWVQANTLAEHAVRGRNLIEQEKVLLKGERNVLSILDKQELMFSIFGFFPWLQTPIFLFETNPHCYTVYSKSTDNALYIYTEQTGCHPGKWTGLRLMNFVGAIFIDRSSGSTRIDRIMCRGDWKPTHNTRENRLAEDPPGYGKFPTYELKKASCPPGTEDTKKLYEGP